MSDFAMISEVPAEIVDDATLDTTMPPEAPQEAAPKKKKGVYRLLALLLLAVCAGLCFLAVNVFTSAWATAEWTLIDTVKNLIDKAVAKGKLFGLPAFVDGMGNLGMIANLSLYVWLAAIALSAVLSLIALFAGNRGLVLTSAFLLTFGGLTYFLSVYCITSCQMNGKATMDYFVAAVSGVALLVAFCLKAKKFGKSAWFWLFNVLLAIAVSVLAFMALMEGTTFDKSYEKIALILAAVAMLFAAIVFCRKKAGLLVSIPNLLVAIAIAVFVFFMDVVGDKVFVGISAGVALLLFLISLPKMKKKEKVANAEKVKKEKVKKEKVKKEKVKKSKKAKNAEVVQEYRKETFVEAYAYDGGPVAGVQIAEEVFPTVAAIEAIKDPDGVARNTVASLLGNGFDPFLITLNEKEKEEFIDLYVLKCKGMMPEIPGYVVGGNNKEFFNCVFIYLGQYREKIPANLLEKMYKFSMKI